MQSSNEEPVTTSYCECALCIVVSVPSPQGSKPGLPCVMQSCSQVPHPGVDLDFRK